MKKEKKSNQVLDKFNSAILDSVILNKFCFNDFFRRKH